MFLGQNDHKNIFEKDLAFNIFRCNDIGCKTNVELSFSKVPVLISIVHFPEYSFYAGKFGPYFFYDPGQNGLNNRMSISYFYLSRTAMMNLLCSVHRVIQAVNSFLCCLFEIS